jgi:carotenoid cleavage dioxygenase-like enzyme
LKNLEVICTVPCRSLLSPSYYHSFGMTDNYFIFIEQPFKLDILKMATAYMRGVNWASCLKFFPEENVRVIRLIFFGNELNESNVSASTLFFQLCVFNFDRP